MNILVIGGVAKAHRCLLADETRRVTVVLPKSTIYKDYLGMNHERILFLHEEPLRLDSIREIVLPMHEATPFHFAFSFHDDYQEIADELCELMNIPSFLPKDLVRLARDKFQMRQTLRDAGFEDVSCRISHSSAELLSVAQKAPFPAVVKPNDDTGSRGVFRVRNLAELTVLLETRQEDLHWPLILEPYLEGLEYSVEAISERGQHRILAITQKWKDPVTFIEFGHLLPAPLPPDEAAEIEDYVLRMLDALEFPDGPSHTEIIVGSSGIHILETHTRNGGGRITDLFRIATGLNMYDWIADQKLRIPVFPQIPDPIPHRCYAATWMRSATHHGILRGIRNADALRKRDGICGVGLMQEPGSKVGPPKTGTDRIAYAIAWGIDPKETVQNARETAALMEIEIEET